MVVGACQKFPFFKQTTCVLGNNDNLGIKFNITWSELLKRKNIQSIKTNFKLATQDVVLT